MIVRNDGGQPPRGVQPQASSPGDSRCEVGTFSVIRRSLEHVRRISMRSDCASIPRHIDMNSKETKNGGSASSQTYYACRQRGGKKLCCFLSGEPAHAFRWLLRRLRCLPLASSPVVPSRL